MNKFVKFYRKMVIAITTFFTCVSGVFLLAGAGTPLARLLVATIFFISLLNLSIYARDLGQAIKTSRPGGVKPEPPAGGQGGKPGGGGQSQGGGGQGQGGGGQGQGGGGQGQRAG